MARALDLVMRILRKVLLLALAAALPAASGCDELRGCDDSLTFGLSIYASYSGALVCDAVVVARDGKYEETLEKQGNEASGCVYVGAGERPGHYVVSVTRQSSRSTNQIEINVEEDSCHVTNETRVVPLIAGQ